MNIRKFKNRMITINDKAVTDAAGKVAKRLHPFPPQIKDKREERKDSVSPYGDES